LAPQARQWGAKGASCRRGFPQCGKGAGRISPSEACGRGVDHPPLFPESGDGPDLICRIRLARPMPLSQGRGLAIEAGSQGISMSRAALRAARPPCPLTGITIRIVGFAAALSHITGYEAAIRPLRPLCAVVGPDLVVVATGSGSNHHKIRKGFFDNGPRAERGEERRQDLRQVRGSGRVGREVGSRDTSESATSRQFCGWHDTLGL
jgi:hypothetical protein